MNQQTKLKNFWKRKGYFVINLIIVTPVGVPDLICLKPAHVVFVESKEKLDKLSPLQRVVLSKLTKLGFDCYVNDKKYTL
jgi:Holliday junction resolvase-like predicted endonuclease